MVSRNANTPEEYLAQLDPKELALLEKVRAVIFDTFPDVEEFNEYGMLGYRRLANLAAQRQYVSLYVASSVLAEYKDQFPGVSCGKSCMRFRNEKQVNEDALKPLLRDVRKYWEENGDDEGGC